MPRPHLLQCEWYTASTFYKQDVEKFSITVGSKSTTACADTAHYCIQTKHYSISCARFIILINTYNYGALWIMNTTQQASQIWLDMWASFAEKRWLADRSIFFTHNDLIVCQPNAMYTWMETLKCINYFTQQVTLHYWLKWWNCSLNLQTFSRHSSLFAGHGSWNWSHIATHLVVLDLVGGDSSKKDHGSAWNLAGSFFK